MLLEKSENSVSSKMKLWIRIIATLLLVSCQGKPDKSPDFATQVENLDTTGISLMVLGTVQDAGSPHIACQKACCADLFEHPDADRKVVSIGLVDAKNHQTFLFEATPDIAEQVKNLKGITSWEAEEIPNGIFLTHAHIGHYTGLMYLGKEAVNTKKTSVYAMPKMTAFLKGNGPWSQLVAEENITLHALEDGLEKQLTPNLRILPFSVPHRDEYSETVGYEIIGPNKKALFIPDIDKWSKWDTEITETIKEVDYAFLDATFFDEEEIDHRDISEIPHPFVIESLKQFETLSKEDKQKIHFIHFNHTNPLLRPESPQTKKVLKAGFRIARIQDTFHL